MIKQMTLRRIPDPVENALRKRAKERGISLNRLSVELLSQALGVDQPVPQKRDLSGLSGFWKQKEYEEFQENTKCFDSIDPEIWS